MSTVRLAKEFSVNIGGNDVTRCTDFSLTLGKNTVDITSFDSDGFEEFLGDNRNWSISFGSMVEVGSAVGTFGALFDLWLADAQLVIKLGDTGSDYFEGTGIFTDLSADGSVGDKISSSGTIQGTGKIARKP